MKSKTLLWLLALVAMLLCDATIAFADQPFRNHRYDAFSVLPADDADILFIGNSITNMHEWWEAFGNDDVCNRGTSGGYSTEILEHLGSLVQGTPRKVFVMIGTNDIGDARPDANTIANIEAILERIHLMSPSTEIYCQGILPCASTDKRPASSIMAVNSAVKDWCEASGYATYLDVWSQLRAGSTNYLKGSYSLDGLHLKASGYKVWCNFIAPQVGSDCTYPASQVDDPGSLGGSYGMRVSAFAQSKVNADDILFVGDEVVHGGEWHELLQSDRVKNRGTGWGFPGPTIAQVTSEMKQILTGRSDNVEPATIVLCAGAADCQAGTAVATSVTNYTKLVKTVRSYAPTSRLVLVSVLPNGNGVTNTSYVEPFNKELQSLAASTENCEYVDIYTPIAADVSTYMNGSYLYGLGYVRMAELLAPSLGLTALSMAEVEGLPEKGTQRTLLVEALAQALHRLDDTTLDDAQRTSLETTMAAAQRVLTDKSATAADCSKASVRLRKALSELTAIDPDGYLLDMSTGSFTVGSGNFRSMWESTATDPHFTFGCGPNNMNTTDGNINIFSGTALSSVYTLTCSAGYRIDHFEFDAKASATGISIQTEAGTTDLTSGKKVHFTFEDVDNTAASFTLKGSNKQVALTDFRVFLKADDGDINTLFNVTTIADGQFAADTEWYFVTIAAAKLLLHDNGSEASIVLSDAYSIYTQPSDDIEWCFTGNSLEGYRLYNRQAGPGKVLAAPTRMKGTTGMESWPILVDTAAIPSDYTADWLFESTSVLGGSTAAYYMYEMGHPSNKVNKRGSNFAFWSEGADGGSAVCVIPVASHSFKEAEKATELFVTTGTPNYRIPAIACTRKGTLIAVGDYRYGGSDIGYGSVELRRRISYDNGETWGDVLEFTHGNKDMKTHPNYHAAYGDPCIVADRESDLVMVMSCSGNTGFPDGTRQLHQGIMRFYSTDEGETWSDPVNLEEMFYSQFDKSARGPIRSMFIGSGKIHQSRYVKVGDYYRLYCSGLVKDVNGTNCNYVFYSDDFGESWKVLGDIDTPAIPSGADEPKAEELPDGSVICSSRINGGRYFNIFTYTDVKTCEGSWGNFATSNASNKGVVAESNSCNGEIMIVPAVRKNDGEHLYLALQSVPFGPSRANVGIYWKELAESGDFESPAAFARQWDGSHQSSYIGSAYSTMCMQADGRLAFFYEESTHGADYTLVYKPYTLEQITDSLYTLDEAPSRWGFMARFIEEKVNPFYTGSTRIVGAPDPDRRAEVDAAVEAFKADPDEQSYNAVFAALQATQLALEPTDVWYVVRNVGRGRYYMKGSASKLSASSSLVSSSAGQHFRFLPVEGEEGVYNVQCGLSLRILAPTGTDGKQLALVEGPEGVGTYTVTSDVYGRSLLLCTNPADASNALFLNTFCDKVLSGSPTDASRWYLEATSYVPTRVDELPSDESAEAPLYDLQGRRVTAPTPGIYIQGGRKVLVK